MIAHPGERVMSEVLLPAQLSIKQAAEQLEISTDTLAAIIRGQGPITEDIAGRLAREFGYSRGWWLALQIAWDRAQNSVKGVG